MVCGVDEVSNLILRRSPKERLLNVIHFNIISRQKTVFDSFNC